VSKDFRKIPINRLHLYAGLDADCTLRIALDQRAKFHQDFQKTWRSVMGPANWALGCMERWGAIVSEEKVSAYDKRLEVQAEELRGVLAKRGLKEDFNPRSPDQLKDLVFGQLALKSKGRAKKTATGKLSLDAETLQGLVTDRWAVPFSLSTGLPDMDPEALAQKRQGDDGLDVILAVIELKDAMNQRSKYGVGYLKHVGYDGRVHTTFKMARTLRLTSNSPNLQNLTSPDDGLPPDLDPGVQARGIYVPPPGWVIISLDYSQAELRWAAALSGDLEMARAFASTVDFHTATAQRIFSIADPKDVTKGQRRISKNVNFGVVFNQGAKTLALQLGCTEDRAQSYIDALMMAYPTLNAYLKGKVIEAVRDGQVTSKWGDWYIRRRLPEIGEVAEGRHVDRMRHHAESVAKNSSIQATANLMCLLSMYRVVRWLKDHPEVPAELNLNVHDALVMYVRKDWWRRVAEKVRAIMLDHQTGVVKMKVDVDVGEDDYGHLSPVKDL
jgi:DNA polymerase-1